MLVLSLTILSREGPCDIYAKGGTPCVAAHSMTRALFAHYTGPLCALQAAHLIPPTLSTVGQTGLYDSI